ncbi:MAG TPA: hypothetical protein VEU08_05830 [Vicinamibacterales bacterium]|nr:hypothetical protein [Vicinamibacterales bacterium]
MPFLRFSRDKRGYELFTLVQADQRGGPSRARVLYAFRTPPNVRVGRTPFDEDTRRALEQAYPGVGFNWRQISETPIPSADAEMWRERRRAMKEAKQALKREEQEAAAKASGTGDAANPEGGSRRRRRRRGRGRRAAEGLAGPAGPATDVATDGDSSSEARSSSLASEEGSENPNSPEETAEPDPSS